MHLVAITRLVGILTFFLGLAMLPPLLVSSWLQDGSTRALSLSAGITAGLGLALCLAGRSQRQVQLSHRDGVAVVTLGWIAAGLFGMLPFVLSGAIPGLTDAYFESVSGFTTTGASIGNIGPGLGLVGPVRNYLEVPVIGKWVLIFCMLLGRLEIYTVIVLLTPDFWRK